MGNLLAEALRQALHADVALMNCGGYGRSPLEPLTLDAP